MQATLGRSYHACEPERHMQAITHTHVRTHIHVITIAFIYYFCLREKKMYNADVYIYALKRTFILKVNISIPQKQN